MTTADFKLCIAAMLRDKAEHISGARPPNPNARAQKARDTAQTETPLTKFRLSCRELVKAKDAERYWRIVPAASDKKVVAMPS